MDELFRDHILDHYRHPRCHGVIDKADASVEDANPLCGDRLRMDFRFAEGRVAEVRFSGIGCSISLAAASMVCEAIEGRTIDEVKAMTRQDVLDLLGVDELGPMRSKCAMLALKTVKAAAYGLTTWTEQEDDEA
jgi:nitrogen fixation NifU-like protein